MSSVRARNTDIDAIRTQKCSAVEGHLAGDSQIGKHHTWHDHLLKTVSVRQKAGKDETRSLVSPSF